jgi:hypothetical protein
MDSTVTAYGLRCSGILYQMIYVDIDYGPSLDERNVRVHVGNRPGFDGYSECVYTQQQPIARRRILSYSDFIQLTNP